jgi:hypothetical protein
MQMDVCARGCRRDKEAHWTNDAVCMEHGTAALAPQRVVAIIWFSVVRLNDVEMLQRLISATLQDPDV